jgi:hypothetical protein
MCCLAATVLLKSLPKQLATALGPFVRILLVKYQLGDWNDTNIRLHVIAPVRRFKDCNDFCSDPRCKLIHLRTYSHTPNEELSFELSVDCVKWHRLQELVGLFCKEGFVRTTGSHLATMYAQMNQLQFWSSREVRNAGPLGFNQSCLHLFLSSAGVALAAARSSWNYRQSTCQVRREHQFDPGHASPKTLPHLLL